MEITFCFSQELKYEDIKQLINKITKDYPKAKIRIIFR